MAIFSVFNYDTRKFDYYQSPQNHAQLGHVFSQFREPSSGSDRIGSYAPEKISKSLPPGVVRMGSGFSPKGVIATTGNIGSSSRGSGSTEFSTGALGIFSAETDKKISLVVVLAATAGLLFVGYKIRKSLK